MQQKVIQIGNSAGIVIPQSIRKEVGLKPGSKVTIEKKGDDIVISPQAKKLAGGVDAKFMKSVDEFMEEHEDVLKELAKR